jgi:fused signal recognition particle receptor
MANNPFLAPRSFLEKIKAAFSAGLAGERLDELEQAMIEADIDLPIVDQILGQMKAGKISSYEEAKILLRKHFAGRLSGGVKRDGPRAAEVILLVGMNGTGKTTTAAKLANLYKKSGKKVLFIAADTFRAAATEQLEAWAGRAGVDIIKGMDGADPASVVFDGIAAAKRGGHNSIIVDTAGRLHTKDNLMQELAKVKKIIVREMQGVPVETYLCIDANTGKNSFAQAKQFAGSIGLTGIILTKFDSSSKGGSVVRIKSELNLPVVYYTFGEKIGDIEVFNAEKFVEKLFE